ncbi:MAG: M24 family metallopeptidase [Bryobacterales bacterium]|nr:M24 family metallopeptidase [Bryobacterales bacterium]
MPFPLKPSRPHYCWALLLLLAAEALFGQSPKPLPPLREQAAMQQQWLEARLNRVLPSLMRKHGVEMWLIICREYNEDPAFWSVVSPTTFAARRRTMYVFFDRGGAEGVERLALGGDSQGGVYEVYRDPELPDAELVGKLQWTLLRKLIESRKPATIAVNVSQRTAFSDGLSASERDTLFDTLGPEWSKRIVFADGLAEEYVAQRIPEMLPTYTHMMEIVHHLINRAFSSEVITPGKTTDEDVVWWLRQQVNSMGLDTWFQPTVRVQKPGADEVSFIAERNPAVIERGDVLHTDFGITALRLNTDTQHMGYVLREGETEPPAGIRAALANAKRVQDIHMEEMRPGRSGNDVLAAVRKRALGEGIKATIYSHPIGDRGHGAGPLIGLWDRQEGVPGRGDTVLVPGTWFSIELNARTPIPEWGGKELFVGMEEDIVLDEQGKARWILRRQEDYHLVR